MSERPECTIKTFGPNIISQRLFRCVTCKFSAIETMCENCAKFCHQGHEVIDLGFHIGYCMCGYGFSKSHCFLENPVPGDLDIPPNESRQCNFLHSGPNYIRMDTYHCTTCNITGGNVTCSACSKLCHKGHSTSFSRNSSSAYCDCGDPSTNFRCLISPPINPKPPLNWCSFFLSGSTSYLEQKCYRCITCGMTGNITLCENCSKYCHAGHEMELLHYSTCYCDCGAGTTTPPCKIMSELEPAA